MLGENDRPVAVDQYPIVHVPGDSSCQHCLLDTSANALELRHAVPVVYSPHILLDDRPGIELFGDVVGRGANELDASLISLLVRVGADEPGSKLWWMLMMRCG